MAQTPTDNQLSEGGTPDPLTFPRHRPVGGPFAQGATLDGATTTTIVIPLYGALQVRFRGLFTVDGTLSFAYRRPPPNTATAYPSAVGPAHADEAVVGATGFVVEITPSGEAYLAVTWTPTGALDSDVNYLDVMQL